MIVVVSVAGVVVVFCMCEMVGSTGVTVLVVVIVFLARRRIRFASSAIVVVVVVVVVGRIVVSSVKTASVCAEGVNGAMDSFVDR